MRILFDQDVPVSLRQYLVGCEVSTAYEKSWSTLRNGTLLDAAEKEGFEVFLTTDQSLQYGQNLSNRSIAIVVLNTTSWPRIKLATDNVVAAVQAAHSGQFSFVDIR